MGEEIDKKIWPISYSLILRPIGCVLINFLFNTVLSVLSACCCVLFEPLEFTVVSNVRLTVLVIMFLKLGEEEKNFKMCYLTSWLFLKELFGMAPLTTIFGCVFLHF